MIDSEESESLPVRHEVVDAGELPERQGVVAFLSGQKRDGPWLLAPATRIAAVLGSVELDLREAQLSAGETTIEIFCLLGSVEIIVPPGVRVLNEGDAFVGNFELQAGEWHAGRDAPIVRLLGTSYLGDVEVRQQAFGESARQARRRRKKRLRGTR